MNIGDKVRVTKEGDIYSNAQGVIVEKIDEAFSIVKITLSPSGKKVTPHTITCWGGELEVIT